MDGGRRERRKAETRQRISDTATRLFMARGFDEVSVSEIAEEADVARPTVFAHFPRKEDLVLDRYPETVELLTGVVRQRPAGVSAVRALRDLLVEQVREGRPVGGIRPQFVPFWQLLAGSRALLARARELAEAMEGELASAMADTGTPEPELTAALTVAAVRTVHVDAVRRVLAGEHAADVALVKERRLTAALDAVERMAPGAGGPSS